jgi:hypothetical protein
MVYNIRRGVFETNSSSTHSVSYAYDDTINHSWHDWEKSIHVPVDCGICTLSTGRYGWELSSYNTATDKAQYLLTYCLYNLRSDMIWRPWVYWPLDVCEYRKDENGLYCDKVNELEKQYDFNRKRYPPNVISYVNEVFARRNKLKYRMVVDFINGDIECTQNPDDASWRYMHDLESMLDIYKTYNDTPIESFDLPYHAWNDAYVDDQSMVGDLSEWCAYHGVNNLMTIIFDPRYSINTDNDNY